MWGKIAMQRVNSVCGWGLKERVSSILAARECKCRLKRGQRDRDRRNKVLNELLAAILATVGQHRKRRNLQHLLRARRVDSEAYTVVVNRLGGGWGGTIKWNNLTLRGHLGYGGDAFPLVKPARGRDAGQRSG